MRRTSYYVLLVVLMGVALVAAWSYRRYYTGEEQKVLQEVVKRGSVQEVVRVRGDVTAKREFDLAFPLTGVVEEVHVRVGDRVEEGTVLARLDEKSYFYEGQKTKASFEDDLEQAQLDYEAAQEDLNSIEAVNREKVNQARTKVLDAKKYLEATKKYFSGVDGDYDEGDATYDEAWQAVVAAKNAYEEAQDTYQLVQKQAMESKVDKRQAVADAEATLRYKREEYAEGKIGYNRAAHLSALDTLEKATLKAPFSGVVTGVEVDVGEVVQAGQLAVAVMGEEVEVEADVSELEIGRVKLGNGVDVLLDAFPDKVWEGSVALIEPKGVEKDGDTFYRVTVELAMEERSSGQIVRPGMSADLTIKASLKEGVLKIPEFFVDRTNSKKTVLVVDGDKLEEVEVVTGVSDGESVEIIKGLTEGQVIGVIAD